MEVVHNLDQFCGNLEKESFLMLKKKTARGSSLMAKKSCQ